MTKNKRQKTAETVNSLMASMKTSPPKERSVIAASTMKTGTKFSREYQGRIYSVRTLASGKFSFQKKTYSSLTAIANEITKGASKNGPRFFGVGA